MLTPAALNLPDKFTGWRENQYETVIKAATSNKYAVLIDAPTGTGKSLVGAAVQRLMNTNATYLVETKQLQDQILRDFPYARTIKGRANYPCLRYPSKFPEISAELCTHRQHECEYIEGCPYFVAKKAAAAAPLAVLNYAYFMSEVNYVGMFAGENYVICDEVDVVENQLMAFVAVVITQRQLDNLDVAPPQFKTKFESWIDWARIALVPLRRDLDEIETQLGTRMSGSWATVDYRLIRKKSSLEKLISKLQFFIKEVDQNWVWYAEDDRWTFKPVWVAKYAKGHLWKHIPKMLGMSATILDPHQLALNTGLSDQEYLRVPSPFPKEIRPIYYEPIANLTAKTMDAELPKLAARVERILNEHANDRILIHTVSYKVRDYLLNNLPNTSRLRSHATKDRAAKLMEFKQSKEPLVMLSPSMDRGVDLPYDECRVVIVCKVPFPNLGDPQISKRVHASKDGDNWYLHKTASSLVQMTGRACRSKDDYSSTYILDEQFSKIMDRYSDKLPEWWKESIIS